MNACLFCKIIDGEIPSVKIYEDKNTLAFLDVNPISKGHTLLVPKKHSRNILEIEDADMKHIANNLKKIAFAVKNGAKSDGINISSNNEAEAGQKIFHTHVHIIPRHSGDGLKHWKGNDYKNGEMEQIRDRIKSNLK